MKRKKRPKPKPRPDPFGTVVFYGVPPRDLGDPWTPGKNTLVEQM